MRFLPGAYSREVAEKHVAAFAEVFAEHGFTLWAVESKATGELLGRVGLWPLKGTDEVELGYVVARSYWNQGIATETSAACLGFGFRELELPCVAAIKRIMTHRIPAHHQVSPPRYSQTKKVDLLTSSLPAHAETHSKRLSAPAAAG